MSDDVTGDGGNGENGGNGGGVAQLKDAGKQVGAGALTGAAQGAAVGGLAGAAAGAAKGAAFSAARNPLVQKLIIGSVIVLVAIVVAVCAAAVGAASTLATAVAGGAEQNTEYAISDAGVDSGVQASGASEAARYGIPKALAVAILDKDDDFDFSRLADALDKKDPQRSDRDLRSGAVASSASAAMTVPKKGEGAELAKRVKKLYIGALKAAGMSSGTAKSVYAQALRWALGDTTKTEEVDCVAPEQPAGGSAVTIDGTSFTAAQSANMKVVIGIAKTMFPQDAHAAAIIGLITVRQESGFRNYANDGVFNSATDPNPGPFGAADYAHLAYSLKLAHDAVGSDHSSLGLMQQQATMGWGDWQGSTWAGGDYKGVINRLMTPSFAIGKFYTRLAAIDDWKNMEPGRVAQRIQVSAYPDAYERHIDLAMAIWEKYGKSAPALAVPKETGWTGATSDQDAAGGTVTGCDGSPVLVDGEYAWPIETAKDGTPMGYISSHYGDRLLNGVPDFHSGLDITGGGFGAGIYAMAAGTVTKSNLFSAACGEYVEIAHADGTSTGYLHMTDRLVSVGDVVHAGQLIAHEGGMQLGGCTFGPHLHLYAYDAKGNTIDPLPYLAQRGLVFPPGRDLVG